MDPPPTGTPAPVARSPVCDAPLWPDASKIDYADYAGAQAKDQAGYFGCMAISESGTRIAAGVPYRRVAPGEYSPGFVYISAFDGTTSQWIEEARITASDGAVNNAFGWRIVLEGNRLVVGAPDRDNIKGAVYIYDLSGDVSSWSGTETLITGGADGQHFGSSVALAGDVLAVGADRDIELGQLRSGVVYIYRYAGSSWSQEAKILPEDYVPAYNSLQFGGEVMLSGDVLAVGARGYRDGNWPDGQPTGAAWVFRHDLCINQIVAAIDGTPARWRGGVVSHRSIPIARPRHRRERLHPTHCLICAQATTARRRRGLKTRRSRRR